MIVTNSHFSKLKFGDVYSLVKREEKENGVRSECHPSLYVKYPFICDKDNGTLNHMDSAVLIGALSRNDEIHYHDSCWFYLPFEDPGVRFYSHLKVDLRRVEIGILRCYERYVRSVYIHP